jgi:hypothetical protein
MKQKRPAGAGSAVAVQRRSERPESGVPDGYPEWLADAVDRLSKDLRLEFPGQPGWSPSNLRRMRRVARVWPSADEFLQRHVGELPWRHIAVLQDRLSAREDRERHVERVADYEGLPAAAELQSVIQAEARQLGLEQIAKEVEP